MRKGTRETTPCVFFYVFFFLCSDLRGGCGLPFATPTERKNMPPMNKNCRSDHQGVYRRQFDKQRAKLKKYAESNGAVCHICGQPIDTRLKYPDPWSMTIDHIVPINKGGHPSDSDNLAVAHFRCNRLKSDKLISNTPGGTSVGNRTLPISTDWSQF